MGMSISVYGVRTRVINAGDDPIEIILSSLPIEPNKGDVLVIATKPLLAAYSKHMSIDNITSTSRLAKVLSEKYTIDPSIAELITRYSSKIYGGVKGFILTNVGGIILPNAGIDHKNIRHGSCSLPYTMLQNVAKEFYYAILRRYGVRVGIVISDSTLFPLKRGTRAIAVYTYGFIPIKKYVGRRDLFGKDIKYTYLNIADEIASAAHLVMGEGDEATPAALVRGVEIELYEDDTTDMMKLNEHECIYTELLSRYLGTKNFISDI